MAVQIISPTSGTVKGTVAVIVSGATTNRVVIRVDGVIKARPTLGSDGKYRWNWITTNYPDGAHKLSVDGGNTLAMTVANAAPAPSPSIPPGAVLAVGDQKWTENLTMPASGRLGFAVEQQGGGSAQRHRGVAYDPTSSKLLGVLSEVSVPAGAPHAEVSYTGGPNVAAGQVVGCGVQSEPVASPGFFFERSA